ncbi:hypothetical protein CERSUDRAFT_159814 [Gelatoporia subvermispora B]|uniref:Cytochrome P450 n=1 Tax=Ceriporiopsis subvermispora (strain B) TaxID=914234 RepID=M2QN54_CERS8|nr:hypothetical protein CERSUDRAFT_159814 [Gelatoporia subvermispora B]
MELSVIATGCLLLSSLILLRYVFGRKKAGSLPPGPKGLPIIGNILDIPKSYEYKTFSAWGDTFGDLVSLRFFGQTIVIINSPQVAFEMLDKKSSIYSDRPQSPIADLAGWTRGLLFTPYGSRFRDYRRAFSQAIGTRKHVKRYSALIEGETHKCMQRILRAPEKLEDHVRHTAGAIILMLSYGYEVQEGQDPLVELAEEGLDQFSQGSTPGAFLVDMLPILRYVPAWMPGAEFKRLTRCWRETMDKMCDIPFSFVKEQMASGAAKSSIVTQMLENRDASPEKEEFVKLAAQAVYSGGADTTVSSIYSFHLTMTLFPEAQKKAQEEIDSVIGTDRLPILADRDRLPYVNALCKEVMRWNPVAPLSAPHRLTQDDFQSGYLVPRGTNVIANQWRFLHDPELYEDPLEFNPDRFMPKAGKEPEQDPRDFAFGFGRRHPKHFRCSIKPRSASAEKLVQEEYAEHN